MHQNHKRIFHKQGNKTMSQLEKDKSILLNTDKLDDAMQELINICQLYNNRLPTYDKENNTIKEQMSNKESINNIISNKLIQNSGNSTRQMTNDSDNNTDNNEEAEKKHSNLSTTNNILEADKIIERLQRKQSELQAQLDDVLKISKRLELKQKHKLNCIFEDDDDYDNNSSKKVIEDEQTDEEDELIEFQKIENDLRISDINRQLDDIQEELRMRLYKRLLSNTNSNCKKQQNLRQTTRRGSQTDESSPTSSSCSDEQPTTSSPSIVDDKVKRRDCLDTVDDKHNKSQHNQNENSILINQVVLQPSDSFEKTENFSNNNLSHNLTPTNSSSGYSSIRSNESLDKGFVYSETNNIYSDVIDNNSATRTITSQSNKNASNSNNSNNQTFHSSILHPNILNKNTSSINSDLERIDEDEEDGQDYYSNSDHYRTIYEEKLSPIIHGSTYTSSNYKNCVLYNQPRTSQTKWHYRGVEENVSQNYNDLKEPPKDGSSDKFINQNSRGIITPKLSKHPAYTKNRPLTLYLPNPDENIDLVEHVQTLGHDLSILSDGLKLTATTAQGYLWKSCSNNSKRWLKRYFYFDRNSKILSYYDNDGQLVNKKKQQSPNNCIPFDKISDVYVDHKLSNSAEKNEKSTSKKKNYVFVLVTTERKYSLSSRRAEIMRAWIDILFTAAKANDYFHHLNNSNDCNEFEVEDDYDDNQGDLNMTTLEVA